MFAPTKTWRKWHKKVNIGQKRYAVASALAASAVPALVMARGHVVDEVPEVPLVLDTSIESTKKTSAAKDILFSARFLEAPEALRLGLVNTVVEDVALDEAVSAYAQRIAANAPLTVHAAKKAIQAFERYSDSAAADEIAPLVLQCFDSEDYREGRRAFLAKRPPIFQGR